jgi:hypothetical protein
MPLKLNFKIDKPNKKAKLSVKDRCSDFIHKSKYTTDLVYYISTLKKDGTYMDKEKIIIHSIDPDKEAEAIENEKQFITELCNRLEQIHPKLDFTNKKSKFLQLKPEIGKLIKQLTCKELDQFRIWMLKKKGYEFICSKRTVGKKQSIFRHNGIKVVLSEDDIKKILNSSRFTFIY